MRVLLISERWESVTDEGMLVFLDRFAQFLKGRSELLVVHERGEAGTDLPLQRRPLGKSLVSPELKECLSSFRPELVLYCPTACATFNALVRHRRLSRAASPIPCALLSLQAREYAWWERPLLGFLKPWRLVVLSKQQERKYRGYGYETLAVKAGVDLEKFQPAHASAREEMRNKLGWSEQRKVVLHVGHLRAGRGLEVLSSLAKHEEFHPVLVASTANAAERSLRENLEEAGVEVHHEYLPKIEELYQAADLYCFPVRDGSGSIEFPLSVVEAMACNLPVVTTPFGALPENFSQGGGLYYFQRDEELLSLLRKALAGPVETRSKVRAFSWEAQMEQLMDELTEAMPA